MNRFLFGRGWVFCDETNGEGDGNGAAGGGETGTDDAGGDDIVGDGEVLEGDADGATDGGDVDGAAAKPKDMQEAIKQGLAKLAPVDEAAKKKADDDAAAAAAAKVEKHANGAPKKDAKGQDLDETGKVVPKQAPKAKTSAELQLSREQLAALKPEARARFQDVIGTLKTREAEIATLNERMKPLEEARASITGVLQETNTTSEELSAYLEFNRLVKSNDPKSLQNALDIVEEQRTALYQALGKEPAGGGIDLLAEFPDLKQKVAEAQITREDALEIANGRREKATRDAQAQQRGRQQQSAQQVQQGRDNALQGIDAWVKQIAASDIDYKAKEAKVIDQVDEVIKNYPPDKWLPTLKLLYQGITITKAAPQMKRNEQPLRPSGAKPGAKAAATMEEAINQGLGYTQ